MNDSDRESERQSAVGQGLLQQLFRRYVVQTLAIYVAVGYGATEILLTASDQLNWPAWVGTLSVAIFIAGLPVVIFLSWALQWTRSGIQVEVRSLRGGLVLSLALALLVGLSSALYMTAVVEAPVAGPERGSVFTQVVASVAIFPFDEEGVEDSPLGMAFAGDLMERLRRRADLYVVSPESALSPVLAGMALPDVAGRLQSDFVVTGTLTAVDGAYRLEANMLKADGTTLWADEFLFAASSDSIAGAQTRLARQLASLAGSSTPISEECPSTGNLQALEQYHVARFKLHQRGIHNVREAREILRHVVELDPAYARAWELLADAYGRSRDDEGGIYQPMSTDAARRALDLCPTLGWAYKIWVPSYEGIDNGHIDQELQFQDALAMEPNRMKTINQYANFLGWRGRLQKELELHERNYRNNPLQPRTIIDLAAAVIHTDPERGRALAEEARAAGAESCNYPVIRGYPPLAQGDRAEFEKALAMIRSDFPECADIFQVPDPEKLFDAIHSDPAAREELLEMVRNDYQPEWAQARSGIAIWLNDLDLAYEAIDEALENDYYVFFATWWYDLPQQRRFRADPRFAEVVERMGLVEYWQEFGWPDGMCSPLGKTVSCR